MRPAGEASLAILQAAHTIRRERAENGKGPTLAELVARSQVVYKAARATVQNLTRAGHLKIVDTCKVPGRNRPAAVYVPADPAPDLLTGPGWADLGNCLQTWTK